MPAIVNANARMSLLVTRPKRSVCTARAERIMEQKYPSGPNPTIHNVRGRFLSQSALRRMVNFAAAALCNCCDLGPTGNFWPLCGVTFHTVSKRSTHMNSFVKRGFLPLLIGATLLAVAPRGKPFNRHRPPLTPLGWKPIRRMRLRRSSRGCCGCEPES
jgi:hypothetical protein